MPSAKKPTKSKPSIAKKKPSSTTTKKQATKQKPIAKKADTAKKASTAAKKAPTKKITKSVSKPKAVAAKTASKPKSSATSVKKKIPTQSKPILSAATKGLSTIAPYQEKKGEAYMNPKQEAHFIDILNAWKFDLMREVDRTKTHMQDEAANYPDPNDRASQEEEFNLELRTRDRERKLIKKIEETLERIINHDYGYCDACGIEIGIRRLEARPTANLCIDCKTLDELKERTDRA